MKIPSMTRRGHISRWMTRDGRSCLSANRRQQRADQFSASGHRLMFVFVSIWSWLPLALADDLTGRSATVAYRADGDTTAPPELIEGEVLVEALDGGLLVEAFDGKLHLIQADWCERVEPLAVAQPTTPAEIGRKVLEELPAGFQMVTTRHYCICFDTSREYAVWVGSVFERLRQGFESYFQRSGLEITAPEKPLIVVIFADRARYLEHAEPALGGASPQVVGYYNLMDNRVTTYDITGSDTLRSRLNRQASVADAVAASPGASALVATLIHEATHQLAFNTGLHQRLAPIPVWVSEGTAMYFETPDVRSERGWRGIGTVNHQRLERWRQSHSRELLSRILVDDDVFRNPQTAVDAYAEAWALTFFLLKTRREDAFAYLKTLSRRGPLRDISSEQRLADFEAAFGGDVESLEPALTRFFARLK